MGSEEMQENFHESSVIILPGVFFFLSGWMTSKTVCFARSNLLHIPHSNGNLGFPVRSQKPERLINQIAKNFPWLSSSQFNEIRGRKRGNYDELHKSDYITPAIISFRYQTVNSWTGQKTLRWWLTQHRHGNCDELETENFDSTSEGGSISAHHK